ncbi:MAG: peptidoglycan-binding protein [Clostridium sp.]|nr:peptidoglycan-binding protein [Clostridium sp.]
MEEGKVKQNKFIKIAVISLGVVILIYFSMCLFFSKHLYLGAKINGIDVSGKSIDAAKDAILVDTLSYSLELKERNDVTEVINSKDIDLKCENLNKVDEIQNDQNPLLWIVALFEEKDFIDSSMISFDEAKLEKTIDKLSCLEPSKVIEPKNVGFEYKDNNFNVVDEVIGTKIDKNTLLENIKNAIKDEQPVLDLDKSNCYIAPRYTKDSSETKETQSLLNKYITTKVNYNFGNAQEVLDGTTINQWLNVDENLNVQFNNDAVKKYVKTLANKYNTLGITRNFKTTNGSTIKVEGGDYGYRIDQSKETEELKEIIKQGTEVSREPIYAQKALTRTDDDIGNTYVEVNLSSQHLWFYKDGNLIVDGAVVSGNVSQNHATPSGVYMLDEKEQDAILRGVGYASKVKYWMPFNGGIGLHDASWRDSFGGSIYKTSGSHGCVNLSYNLAKTIYNNIKEGTPIICYY